MDTTVTETTQQAATRWQDRAIAAYMESKAEEDAELLARQSSELRRLLEPFGLEAEYSLDANGLVIGRVDDILFGVLYISLYRVLYCPDCGSRITGSPIYDMVDMGRSLAAEVWEHHNCKGEQSVTEKLVTALDNFIRSRFYTQEDA